MEEIEIEWEESVIRFEDIETHKSSELNKEHGFYVIISGIEKDEKVLFSSIHLHYIGLAYNQTLRKRILQEDTHPAYKKINKFISANSGTQKYVRLGKLVSKSQSNDSETLFKDIEACLIYDNQPDANTQNKDSYNGREIKVVNTGNFYPLRKVSDSTDVLEFGPDALARIV